MTLISYQELQSTLRNILAVLGFTLRADDAIRDQSTGNRKVEAETSRRKDDVQAPAKPGHGESRDARAIEDLFTGV